MVTNHDSETMASWIAVVNDDDIQLQILCGLLEHAGYRVLGFHSAKDALAGCLQGNRPSLIVTDLHMPELDGCHPHTGNQGRIWGYFAIDMSTAIPSPRSGRSICQAYQSWWLRVQGVKG